MIQRKPAQYRLAFLCQAYLYLPSIALGPVPSHQPGFLQPVDQPHRAVMPQLQPFGQVTDVRIAMMCLDGQQQLVLRRFQACPARRLVAEVQELADLVSKLR